MVDARKIEYIVGKSECHGWVNVNLNLNRPPAPKKLDTSSDAWGRALVILWQHEALHEVAVLTEDEWLNHEASSHCGISHIDLGLEVLH